MSEVKSYNEVSETPEKEKPQFLGHLSQLLPEGWKFSQNEHGSLIKPDGETVSLAHHDTLTDKKVLELGLPRTLADVKIGEVMRTQDRKLYVSLFMSPRYEAPGVLTNDPNKTDVLWTVMPDDLTQHIQSP